MGFGVTSWVSFFIYYNELEMWWFYKGQGKVVFKATIEEQLSKMDKTAHKLDIGTMLCNAMERWGWFWSVLETVDVD